jgi:hypothetical protein
MKNKIQNGQEIARELEMTKIKPRKKWKKAETLKRENTLREIFKDRKNVFKGLTREETIAEYTGKDLSTVLNWNREKTYEVWHEICTSKKLLRKEAIMAIIHKPMPRGTSLTDKKYGRRELPVKQNVFFRCTSEDEAWAYRNVLDKISKGIYDAGEKVVSIVEEELKENPVMKIIQKGQEQQH